MNGVKKSFVVKCIVVFLLVAAGVVALFVKLVDDKNEKSGDSDYPKTAYDILAARDLEDNYPSTVSEVLKLYNRYLQYIYNNNPEDDKFEVLVDRVRQMWSEEWLKLNDRETHLAGFHKEVEEFSGEGRVMSNYLVSDGSSAKDFVTPEGVSGKTLTCSYLYTEKEKTYKIYLKYYFLLENGKWKILYYEQTDNGNTSAITDGADATDATDAADE